MRQLFFYLFIFLCSAMFAQELSVKEFREATNDLSARTKPRQDNNGNDCALVKVQLAAPSATFTGNVMGDVSFKKNEYWVYMTNGSKRLKVIHPSYLPLEVSFADYGVSQLTGKSTYILTLLLGDLPQGIQQPKVQTGWILLDSEPQGASVYINDVFVGNTPLDGYKQPYGTYSYRVELPNYHSSSGSFELNAGRLEKKITLLPAFGAISIKCNVAGATVLLDGKATGKNAPCTLQEVASGQHTVTIQMEKYAPRQENVIVEDGKTANMDISLNARFASISIASLEGAQIFCNGREIGKTTVMEDMMEGYYDIEVKLNHHKTVTKQIQVSAGQPQQITLNPTPIYGSLDITSTPRDANITIDGKSYGKTPFTVEQLLEGEHYVVLSKEGYSSFQKVVNVLEGNTETLSATMQEGSQILIDESKSSITISGRMTDKDWKKLRQTCEQEAIKSIDLSEAEIEIIPSGALDKCKSLTSITIPNSVTSIGNSAFSDCSGLTSINIPNNVTSIGHSAFRGCRDLTSINIPSNVTSIGEATFEYCSSLSSVSIPNSITSIGLCAFEDCSSLTSINIPNSVTNIGAAAFAGCRGLTSVSIGNSVTSIGNGAFKNCNGLTSVNIPNSVTSIGDYAFSDCGSLSSVHIPNSLTSIGDGAFYGCKNLTSVNIPNSVASIGTSAFNGCSSLVSVTIPGSVKSIGGYAFDGTAWYDKMPDGLIYLGKVAYKYKGKMAENTSITIQDGTISISVSAFSGCSGLTSIIIPNSVKSIGEYAFSKCTNLTSIAIPNSVTSIGYDAFDKTAWYDNMPNGLVYAGKVAYKYKGEMPENTSITIQDGTLSIRESAFYKCSGLTSVTIGNSVTSIGDEAFSHCSGLTSVNIPNSVTTIGDEAFRHCSGLTSVNIPNSVTNIGDKAFSYCSGLTSVSIGNSVTSIGDEAFCCCSGLTSITIGNSVTSIGHRAFLKCSGLTSVTIPGSVTRIGGRAFDECSGLSSVTIGNSVTSIGYGVFSGCSGLTSVTIPGSVTSIEGRAFSGCSGLTSVTISGSHTDVDESAFENCNNITLYVPKRIRDRYIRKNLNGVKSIVEK